MRPTFATPEPTRVWSHFFDLVSTPRPSKNEGAAIDHIEQWAKQLGFISKRDKANNLCVHVPASVSTDKLPVILQCHVDIVSVTAENNPMGADASAGRIPMVRGDFDPKSEKKLIENSQGDWINSPYTTLGADNGIGVAMMMALAEQSDRTIPLELLFTIDEEQGMTGAIGLDVMQLGLTGNYLVNIDTEEDDEITIGSAGGRDVEILWNGQWGPVSGNASYSLKVDGLKGGHSGIEINQGRANANRVLARAISAISKSVPLQFVEWTGGSRRNAIPDKSSLNFVCDAKHETSIREILNCVSSALNKLYENRDNRIEFELAKAPMPVSALSDSGTQEFLKLVQGVPTGICEMTPELPVLVEASCNMAIIQLENRGAGKITCSVRGTTPQALADVSDTIEAVASLAKAVTTIADGYPGWKPHLDSALLKVAVEAYRKLFNAEPKVHAVHAGLECGLLVEKLPGLHAISIGPTIKGNHAVGERVQVSSVAKSYRYVESILAGLSQ